MHRLIAAFMMGVLGAILFVSFALQDIRLRPDLPAGELPWGLIIRYGIAMTLGGGLAGYIFGGLFGRTGMGGWVLTLCFGFVASAFGGLLGSAMGLMPDMLAGGLSTSEIIQIAAGLLILPLALIEQPWLVLVVTALFVMTHLRCRKARPATQ